jgi:mono/diheme cytochrome c family protein
VVVAAAVATPAGQQPVPDGVTGPLPAGRTAEDVYRAGCATCHGPNGKGSPRAVVGFDVRASHRLVPAF